jgi:hypothetical protein
VVGYSDPVFVACQSFVGAQVRVVAIGDEPTSPNQPIPVSDVERVRVGLDDVPEGAVIQLVAEPVLVGLKFPSDHVEFARGSILATQCYFGRFAIGRRELDLYSRYVLTCVVATYPLPVKANGLTNQEYVDLEQQIKATSAGVEVVRAVMPDAVQVRITRIGASTDGTNWLASPVQRLDGTFLPGRRYVSKGTELVTVLVREVSSRSWYVAGWTRPSRTRTTWTIPTAVLVPPGARTNQEFFAIAVCSYTHFSAKEVADVEIEARQLAVSGEYRFVVRQAGEER